MDVTEVFKVEVLELQSAHIPFSFNENTVGASPAVFPGKKGKTSIFTFMPDGAVTGQDVDFSL